MLIRDFPTTSVGSKGKPSYAGSTLKVRSTVKSVKYDRFVCVISVSLSK